MAVVGVVKLVKPLLGADLVVELVDDSRRDVVAVDVSEPAV